MKALHKIELRDYELVGLSEDELEQVLLLQEQINMFVVVVEGCRQKLAEWGTLLPAAQAAFRQQRDDLVAYGDEIAQLDPKGAPVKLQGAYATALATWQQVKPQLAAL